LLQVKLLNADLKNIERAQGRAWKTWAVIQSVSRKNDWKWEKSKRISGELITEKGWTLKVKRRRDFSKKENWRRVYKEC
jgi:hypothetical protein